jgi:branched-chain amino acid transport system ATP-binding protein
MLRVEDLVVRYGEVEAIRGLSMTIEAGSVVAVLGPNGAGKTTLVKTIAGLLKPAAGRITYDGEEIGTLAPHLVAGRGIATVPEGRELFPHMTVEENLELGAFTRTGLRPRRADAAGGVQEDLQRVFEYFPVLQLLRKRVAAGLSGGEQQMVAIGRALMARPRLLLLDEPSLGLAPLITREIFRIIEQIQGDGVTMLLVEQNVAHASSVADYAYVMGNGRLSAEGSIREMRSAGKLTASYLGATDKEDGA